MIQPAKVGMKYLIKVRSLLTDFVKTDLYNNSFFQHAKAIATGFDDGDLVEIQRQ